MAEPAQYYERSLRDFFYILFRHKWKVIFFFLAVMITVTVGTLLATDIYKADAKLLVRIGRESVSLDPTVTTSPVLSIGQSRENEINSELEILKSRELAEKVVDTLGAKVFLGRPDDESMSQVSLGPVQDRLRDVRKSLGGVIKKIENFLIELNILPSVSEREKVLNQLMKNLAIEVQKNSSILLISYEDRSPKLAQNVLVKLIGFYNDKHLTIHRTVGSYKFFDQQADQLRGEVTRTENELKRLKSRTGVSSLDEQRRILLSRMGALQQGVEGNQAALVISRAKVQSLEDKLAVTSPTLVTQETKGTNNYAADQMRFRLYELQLKEQDLLSKYKEESKSVQEIRRQIAEAQALLAKEEPTRTQITTAVNPTHQQLNLDLIKEVANLSSLEANTRVLKDQQDAARGELTGLNETEEKMVNLQRELGMLEGKYRKYFDNLEQARIDQALETSKISNISIVQPATASMIPVKPRKMLYLALGLFLGIFGSIALAFFSEVLDHSVRTPKDVEERLQLPLLASIPYSKK